MPPQILAFEFGEDPLNAEDMASLTCTVNKGDLPLSITWTLNEKSVYRIPGITVLQTNKRISQLSIESIQADHTGAYSCIASNSAGTNHHTAYLNVNGS